MSTASDPMPGVTLHLTDAAELAEMLSFITEWLASDRSLEASFAGFVGHPAYGTRQLRDDLDRFVFLLGGSDGEQFLTAGPGDPPP